MLEQQTSSAQSGSLIAFTIVGEGLAPAFGDGEVIVSDRGETPKPGSRMVLELTDGRALFVRLLKVSKPAGVVHVEHLISRDRTAFLRHEVAHLGALRASYGRGHAPRVGIAEWRELQTSGSLR